MKSLIQFIESLRILFIRSNLQTRSALVLCTALLSVGVGLMAQNANLFSTQMEDLLGAQEFSPQQLDQFELAFSSNGLGRYERVGNRMRVPTASKDTYLKTLSQAKCLPANSDLQNNSASDPLRFLEPRNVAQERERRERLKQIESTLKEFPFVRQAVVSYDEKSEGFSADKKRAATVSIHPKNKLQLSRSERRSIIRLVQMHFPGLKAAEIVLVDLGLGETFTELTLDSQAIGQLAQSDSHWTDRRREHEEELKKKAMELLAGYGDVQIAVSSEPVGLSEINDRQDASENQVSPQAASLIPNRKARLGDLPASKEALQSTPQYTSRISVSIPTSYYRRAYRHDWQATQSESDNSVGASMSSVASNMPALSERALEQIKTQTIQAIRSKLTPLIAHSALGNPDIESRMIITDHIDSIDSIPNEFARWQALVDWLADSWKTLGLFALVLIAMLLLRSLATSRNSRETIQQSSKQTSGASLLDLQEQPQSIQQDAPLAIPSMKISTKIQSQPEQVASRLASWISQN